ncbi:MAG: type II secretion system F family protein [Bacillota bacterium]|nr:type II secretion system F family protein [Bacillota bacterium]
MNEKRFSNQEISHFCRGLSLLLHAGISIGDGIFLLAEEEEAGSYRSRLEEMGKAMDSGLPLTEAMGSGFPSYVTGMVQVGENSGRLEEALLALSDYYEERERMDRQLRNALTYPAIVLLLMLIVIGVLLVRVLPVFDAVYASLGGRLTGIAGGLLSLGQMMKAALPVLCILLAAVVIFVLAFASSEALRQKLVLKWNQKHGDKGVAKIQNDARFAQALSMGLKSGLPMEEAVSLAGTLLQDVPEAAKRYAVCSEALAGGEELTKALKETGALPASACRMLELGVRGGNSDTVMEEIAARLSEEAVQALEDKTAQVEPAMVLGASLLVGIILLSVMLPLMNIMSAIG